MIPAVWPPRHGQRLSTMTSVRIEPDVNEAIKTITAEEGVTVGSWIRRLIQREIDRPAMAELSADGLDEPLRIPKDALDRVVAALIPALAKHGSLDLRVDAPTLKMDGAMLDTTFPITVKAGAERPTGLIPGSGQRGEPKALSSSLSLRPRTFSCPHLSVGHVASAACGTCGPLEAA